MSKDSTVQYQLNDQGQFVIEGYNHAKTFSNFFPGVAGLWGIPMWVFYVNRGQGVASFGIESKDKAIVEFLPANKSYRSTPLIGFRTFLKIKQGAKVIYWEPFQTLLEGTNFTKKSKMLINAHDLTIEETNVTLGVTVRVNYFTLADEPFAGLVRHVSIINESKKNYSIEMIDGLPAINSYGLNDWAAKNMCRTVEAWIKVRNIKEKAPYYQLNVEVSDKPEVKHIKEGNFYFAFDPSKAKDALHSPLVEASAVFGQRQDFSAPEAFLNSKKFEIPANQQTDNRTPCAMTFVAFNLKAKQTKVVASVFGYANSVEQVTTIVKKVTAPDYLVQKARRNKDLIDEIKNYAFTNSSSRSFDLYAGHTFLDNILRGGLPISLQTQTGKVAFNVYSRKHGDLERDYNYFTVAPTYYSQGNGNYRDVNQNRRNDVFFNPDVRDSHLINFLNLIQADGFNPLVVKGTSFVVEDKEKLEEVLQKNVAPQGIADLRSFLKHNFLPGALLDHVEKNSIVLKVSKQEFLGSILNICRKQELAEHGEGFWVDHWTYNIDLVESFAAVYPEEINKLILNKKVFTFFHDSHYVLPRDKRYILTNVGVRQFKAVHNGADEIKAKQGGNLLRIHHGEGEIYFTHFTAKMLCLIANKVASFDPAGVGIAMEADKPSWYDALNGLPGLLGSSISETFALKRYALFMKQALEQLNLPVYENILLFKELADFIRNLNLAMAEERDPLKYWVRSNDIKEFYRQLIRKGIDGKEDNVPLDEIKKFLDLVIKRCGQAIDVASKSGKTLPTYFYYEAETWDGIAHSNFVNPKKFKRHDLPPFLEGYVHALRVSEPTVAKKLYTQVRNSGLFDKKLKMYKVNDDISSESEEIGRTRIFPAGWLENESVWLHMEYKFILELLRQGMPVEFYDNFKNVMIPFLKPEVYGRSILENSSFIVSSAHNDKNLHGQGFVARLSGSTAEFLHMWLWMNAGLKPFVLDEKKELALQLQPILPGWLFTTSASTARFYHPTRGWQNVELPKNTYAFKFLGHTLVVYHNSRRADTFGTKAPRVKKIDIRYVDNRTSITIEGNIIPAPHAEKVRSGAIDRIDIYLG